MLAHKYAAGVRLVSRNGRDLTRRFPELAAAVAALEPPKGRRRDPATSHGPGTLGRLANVIGIVAALVALGLIGYFASLGIQLWRPGGG